MSCYYADGRLGEGLVPCNTTAVISHCCRDGDLCVKNGFCFSTGLSALVRRGCTDPSFNGTCPQQCITDKFKEQSDLVLTPCDIPYSFACGQDQAARNACTSGNGTFNIQAGAAGLLIGQDTSSQTVVFSSMVSVTTTVSATATTTAPATSTASPSKDCTSDTDTKVGLGSGLGAPLGISIIAAIIFFILWRKAEGSVTRANHWREDAGVGLAGSGVLLQNGVGQGSQVNHPARETLM